MLEDEGRERKVGGTRFPERGYPLVQDAVREQAADDAVLVLHRVEVGVSVAPAHSHPRDEVVKHEVVEDDDTGISAKRIDDPGVCIRVVTDVVERHVRSPGSPPAPTPHDCDVEPLAEGREKKRAVVGDAALLRRHRAEVGNPHERSLAIARSQVTPAAIA